MPTFQALEKHVYYSDNRFNLNYIQLYSTLWIKFYTDNKHLRVLTETFKLKYILADPLTNLHQLTNHYDVN